MQTIKLADALNNSANISKSIKTSAATPIEFTDSVWTDLRMPFTQAKQGNTSLPNFDYTNIGLLFPNNDPDEIVYMIAQFPHGRKLGAAVKPHIHWQQSAATAVVWKMEYKWVNNGGLVPAAFTLLTADSNSFTWESGNLAQISPFGEITPTEGDGVSSYMLIKLYRDDATTAGDVLAFEFDIHYQIDTIGSKDEFVK